MLLGTANGFCPICSSISTIIFHPTLLDKPAVAHGIFTLPTAHSLQPIAYSLSALGIKEIQVILACGRCYGIANFCAVVRLGAADKGQGAGTKVNVRFCA